MSPSKSSPGLSLAELAAAVGGSVDGDDQTLIRSVAPIQSAGPGDISFVANPKYAHFIETTGASALILDPHAACPRLPVLRHEKPYLAFARVVRLLVPDEPFLAPGIHSSAVIEPGAQIDPTAAVGPLCVVRQDSIIGHGCQLVSSVFVGRGVSVGRGCLLYPGVRIMDGCRLADRVILHAGVVIGSDGFGYAESETGLEKIKQVGWVEIGEDVEIGANTTVDRGAIGPTRIGRGTKIDNLVQIAHNVEIGDHCIVVSQVGISGSTRLGNGVILAGQVGLIGHIEIGDGARVGAQSGVSKSIPPGQRWFGYPARESREAMRIGAALLRLPDLLKRVRKIEERLVGKSGD